MSSTRVMATCSLLGQAVGTAAAIAVKDSLTPRGVGQSKIHDLQQQLIPSLYFIVKTHLHHLFDSYFATSIGFILIADKKPNKNRRTSSV
jgi:hypothetical protein